MTTNKAPQSLTKKMRVSMPSFFVALLIAAICSVFLGLSFEALPWDLLTILAFSVAFASADFVDALRQRRDFFSPRSLVSILMILSVYVAPVMHIALDAYPRYVRLPDNMIDAMTSLIIMQLLGHSVYFLVLRLPTKVSHTVSQSHPARPETISYLQSLRFWLIVLALLSFGLFTYTVIALGGPAAWLEGQLNRSGRGVLSGAVLSLAEAFPLLLFIAFALHLKITPPNVRELKGYLCIAFLLLVLVTFLTSGLRGSRASLIWPVLVGLVIIHLLFFTIRARIIVVIALVGVSFAGVYDIYKKAGTEGIEQLQRGSLESIDDYAGYGFGPVQLLLGDFSRTAVQTIVLDRWEEGSFDPYLGATYIGDAIAFIPGSEPLESLPSKSVAGTDVLYGEGSSQTRAKMSTRIFGLQGEALMNFGPAGAVIIFIPYALVMRRIEAAYTRASEGESIRSSIYVALLIPATALLFLSDLDNVFNNLTSIFILPAIALFLASVTRDSPTKPSRVEPFRVSNN